jgi:hypothetical protein
MLLSTHPLFFLRRRNSRTRFLSDYGRGADSQPTKGVPIRIVHYNENTCGGTLGGVQAAQCLELAAINYLSL